MTTIKITNPMYVLLLVIMFHPMWALKGLMGAHHIHPRIDSKHP